MRKFLIEGSWIGENEETESLQELFSLNHDWDMKILAEGDENEI